MNIRKYRQSDAEEKAELHKKSIRNLAEDDYTQSQIEAWSDVSVEEDIDESKTRYVAVEDGKLVGFGEIDVEEEEVTGLYVHPGFSGEGVGTKLLRKVEEKGKDEGLELLTCISTITAKDFYQKNGWEVVQKTDYEINGEDLPVYRMKKRI